MSYKNNQEKSKGMTRRVKGMAIIVVDNNNTNEGNKMSKFNENVQVEETNEYQIGELMNELNKCEDKISPRDEIQVGDKVKWSGPQSLNCYEYGYVTSTDEKVIGNPCYGIRECAEGREIKVSKDQVTHASSRYVRA